MKKLQLILGLFIFLGVFSAGCLNDDNKIPPNCFDGILNNGEEKIDCGGPCIACDPCENGLWDYELGETWVDCGGDCGECPPHANGCQDAGESGIDCGGTSGIACNSLCNDGLPNGWEDGAISPLDTLPFQCDPNLDPIDYLNLYFTDCGGDCEPCEVCDDNLLNQDETWIDSGGLCGPCADGNATTGGSCINGFQDGQEVDVDCGGVAATCGVCPPCEVLLECDIDGVHREFLAVMTATMIPWVSSSLAPRVAVEFTGASQDGWVIEGRFSESDIVAWPADGLSLADVSVFCNEDTFGGNASSYLRFTSAEITGGAATTETISSIINPGQGITYNNFTKLYKLEPGYFKGEFSGICKTTSFTNINITNGKFKLITPSF